ncbi:MAG: hypothetical protein AAF415_02385 [Pseudomonadota bacterium]
MTDILPPPDRANARQFRRHHFRQHYVSGGWSLARVLGWALLSIATAAVVVGTVLMAIDAILFTLQIAAR